jgi:hypothetical protein
MSSPNPPDITLLGSLWTKFILKSYRPQPILIYVFEEYSKVLFLKPCPTQRIGFQIGRKVGRERAYGFSNRWRALGPTSFDLHNVRITLRKGGFLKRPIQSIGKKMINGIMILTQNDVA